MLRAAFLCTVRHALVSVLDASPGRAPANIAFLTTNILKESVHRRR